MATFVMLSPCQMSPFKGDTARFAKVSQLVRTKTRFDQKTLYVREHSPVAILWQFIMIVGNNSLVLRYVTLSAEDQ